MKKNECSGIYETESKDQSRYSLEYQERSIREYCSRNNLNLTALYKDNGESSYTFDRPDYKALEVFLKKHKGQNQYFIIMNYDRFSRNLPEALLKITELEAKFQIKVVATNEAVDIDTSDPAVFMQRAFSYLMANQELFRIRKRTKDGIRQAQISGRYIGMAPFGYKNGKDPDNKSVILIDEEKAPIVKKIFEDYLSGTPIFEIFDEVRKIGFTRTGNSAIHLVLGNALYAGLVRVTGDKKSAEKLVKGIHEPLVSEADYWLTQERLGNKRAQKSQPKDDFPLRGILKCWCGKSMTAGFSKGRNKYYLYYRCLTHTETNISGTMLHEKMEELFDLLSFTRAQVDQITLQSRKVLKESTKEKESLLSSREKQLAEVNQKIDKLEGRLMNDEIDGATYKKWFQKFSHERAVISEDINQISKGEKSNRWDRLERLLPELTGLKNIYVKAPLHRKQMLIRKVFKHNLVFSEGAFRTASIEPAFYHNSLIAKEKGLLFVEQPYPCSDKILSGSPYGTNLEPFYDGFEAFSEFDGSITCNCHTIA